MCVDLAYIWISFLEDSIFVFPQKHSVLEAFAHVSVFGDTSPEVQEICVLRIEMLM